MHYDEIIYLPSGTELSIDAAIGDVSRAIESLELAGNESDAQDLRHVIELLDVIAAREENA